MATQPQIGTKVICKKGRMVDSDSFEIILVFTHPLQESYDIKGRYIISSNSAHFSTTDFEERAIAIVFDVEISNIRDDIENRKIKIQ